MIKKKEKKKEEESAWWRKYTKAHLSEGDLSEKPEDNQDMVKTQEVREIDPLQEIDKVFGSLLGGGNANPMTIKPKMFKLEGRRTRAGSVSIQNTRKEIIARIELPGVNKEDIKLNVEGNQLIIEAVQRNQSEREGGGFAGVSSSYKSIRKSIPLPAYVEKERSSAKYEDGFLIVTLPKKKRGNGPSDIPIE
ncbi:Hsp20/alpha crystallin family protein [Candidatus Undinarchaeota archaeon]